MSAEDQATAGGPYDRQARVLAVAYGTQGALTYGFLGVVAHNTSASDYSLIVALYTAVFICFTTLCRPIESFLSHSVSGALAERRPIGSILREGIRVEATIMVTFLAAALAARGPIQEDVFGNEPALYWAFLAAVLGFSANFFARGYLAGRRLFGHYSALLVVEGVTRISFVLVALAVGFQIDEQLAAAAIAAAPAAAPLAAVLLLRARHAKAIGAPAAKAARVSGTAFTMSVVVILACEQTFLSAGPLFVRTGEDAVLTGLIFNELVLAVGPLFLFQAALTVLLPSLTGLNTRKELTEFNAAVRTTLMGIAALTAALMAVVFLIGPSAMQIAFGDEFEYERAGLLIVALGMGFYLAASTFSQSALARGRASAAALRWTAAAAAFAAWNVLSPLEPVRTVEIGFAGGALLLCGLLAVMHYAASAWLESDSS